MERLWASSILALVLFSLWIPAPAASQCAMCVTGLTQSEEGRAMAQGYNHAILFLLFFPYMIVAAFVFGFFRLQARKQGVPVRALLRRRRRNPQEAAG